MSIYCTLGIIGVEKTEKGYDRNFATVAIQGVPGHIKDECVRDGQDGFLPPPVEDDAELRAVYFVLDNCTKGTSRSGQEYADPLLVLTGKEYKSYSFDDLLTLLTQKVQERFEAPGEDAVAIVHPLSNVVKRLACQYHPGTKTVNKLMAIKTHRDEVAAAGFARDLRTAKEAVDAYIDDVERRARRLGVSPDYVRLREIEIIDGVPLPPGCLTPDEIGRYHSVRRDLPADRREHADACDYCRKMVLTAKG